MMFTRYKEIVFVALLMVSFSVCSQEMVTKKIEKTLEMTHTGELQLNNKYGNIIVNGWKQNSIEIIIDIKVTNKKKDNAKSLLDRIKPEFKTAGDYMSITSEISDKNKSLFSRFFNKINPIDLDKSNVEINYTINLPINAEIDVTNKFGDVILKNWNGKLKANVQHGDLWINEAITNANIDMKFGKLRTKSVDYASIYLKNGSIDIEESKDLILNTSGSTIQIDVVSDLELVSSKDEITVEQADKIHGELSFSNAQINSVENGINLIMKVAELRVYKINNPDAVVTINQESSEINIAISNLAFKFNATLEEGLLRLPKTFSNINTTVLDKSKRIREITASYGSPNLGAFRFTGKKGIITLKE
ncbi:hypothetical protein [Hwangdonia lutea]|uniref:Adhesin domain-containing protein n=1 Tax=Hwangdonia lutea TaxID=3075823 RepID=A0AA97EKV5_9FLAO|nr:hypothetical protein [Hwangdonia sp. SCSIO 19198]WOD43289.1 hypothetical protein RNZ46_14965 [Hwangdonia sp. SCSIO 19198]